jgi:trimeric autotransporter adhesin
MVGMLLAFSGVAWAATTLSNTSDPVPQPNGRVRAVLVSDNTIYLGGSFTSVDGLSRNRLAAIDANTGQLTDWAPSINKPVRALAVSSDGTRIYAGGEFTRAGGKVHNYVAEIDATTGAVIHSWNPSADAPVYALAVLGPRVYLGGAFGAVDGQSRTRLAAVDALTGALDPQWKPTVGGGVEARVLAFAPSTDGTRLYVGGEFGNISDKSGTKSENNLAALDQFTGTLVNWDPRPTPPYPVLDLDATDAGVYVAGGGGGGTGARFDAANGALLWSVRGDGDFNGVALLDDKAYFGGHFLSLTDGTVRKKFLAVNALTGALDPQWKPKAGKGSPWTLAADTSRVRLYAGGDFQTIASQPQQRLARFSAQ